MEQELARLAVDRAVIQAGFCAEFFEQGGQSQRPTYLIT
jgi:hypothetical protein